MQFSKPFNAVIVNIPKLILVLITIAAVAALSSTTSNARDASTTSLSPANTTPDNPMTTSSLVSNLTVADIWNNGDASDLEIRFDPALDTQNMNEYRIMIVKAENAAEFNLTAAQAVPVEQYTRVESDGAVQVELPSTATDTDGDPITEDTAYISFVLSIGDDEDTLVASDEITLRNETIVRTLVPELESGTGGVAVDGDGNVYIGNMGLAPARRGTEVFRITPDGEVSVFADGLLGASGNAFDAEGNLYQSSFTGDTVSRITPDGEVTEYVTEGVNGPVGIVVAEDGTLYIASCGNGSVYQVNPDGQTERFALSALLNCPNGIARDGDGNLYVANFRNGRILKLTPDGTVSEFVELPGRNNGHLIYNGDGLLYATARSAHQIYAITLDGEVELLAGSGERGHDDGPAPEATFSLPNDINISPDGRVLYVNEVFTTTRTLNTPSVVRMIILARE